MYAYTLRLPAGAVIWAWMHGHSVGTVGADWPTRLPPRPPRTVHLVQAAAAAVAVPSRSLQCIQQHAYGPLLAGWAAWGQLSFTPAWCHGLLQQQLWWGLQGMLLAA